MRERERELLRESSVGSGATRTTHKQPMQMDSALSAFQSSQAKGATVGATTVRPSAKKSATKGHRPRALVRTDSAVPWRRVLRQESAALVE
jgi:hypothetical protein